MYKLPLFFSLIAFVATATAIDTTLPLFSRQLTYRSPLLFDRQLDNRSPLFFGHQLTNRSPLLFGHQLTARDSCSAQGEKECGTGCIPLTDTCCPDGSGGCPSGKYCDLDSSGIYGCCTNGKTCSGATTSCASEGKQDCGTGCIPLTDTCCPDGSGGCPASEYCVLGSDNVYGCCDIGQTCNGSGGNGTCTDQGEADCGTICIPLGDTCCPDGLGGCPASKYCMLGSDNVYGCCDIGQTCNGSGGNGTCADQGEADCGTICIPLGDTCCPDESGGCPASRYCVLGSNNVYGCCDNGHICTGEGGVSTTVTGGETLTESINTTPSSVPTQATTFPTTTTAQTTTPKSTSTTSSTTRTSSATVTTTPITNSNGAASQSHGGSFAASILGTLLAALFIFF